MKKVLKGFFVIEGLDGAGTTTQLKLICKTMQDAGIKVFSTFEPTDSEIGCLIKRILKGETKATPLALAYLYAADRENHLHDPNNGILAHLQAKDIVISDRYFFSSLAYQTISSPYAKVEALNMDFPYPEAVIFIDTPVTECIKRIDSRGDTKEIFEKLSVLENVKSNYETAFSQMPSEVILHRLDGKLSREELQKEIMAVVFDKKL